LLGEIVFPPSDSSCSQHVIDEKRLGGLKIEDWPTFLVEFEDEFNKPRLDLEKKYKKPLKITKQPSDLHDSIVYAITYCWDQTVQVYLDQNFPGKYKLEPNQANTKRTDIPDATLMYENKIPILAIEVKRTHTMEITKSKIHNREKQVRVNF
jgi:hypothetical protein